MADIEFYLVDEKCVAASGGVCEVQDILYFRHDKAGFNSRANKEHVKNYATDYANFKLANPDFKLSWGEASDSALQVGENVHTPVTERPADTMKDISGAFVEPGKVDGVKLKKEHTDRDRPVA